jgi:hypothetical protein
LFVVAGLTGCGESSVDNRSKQPDASSRDDGQEERNENGNNEDAPETGSGSVDAPSRTATAFCTPIRLESERREGGEVTASPSIDNDSANTQLYSDSGCQKSISRGDVSDSRDDKSEEPERDNGDDDKEQSDDDRDSKRDENRKRGLEKFDEKTVENNGERKDRGDRSGEQMSRRVI